MRTWPGREHRSNRERNPCSIHVSSVAHLLSRIFFSRKHSVMLYLIDGYNLLNVAGVPVPVRGRANLEKARLALLNFLAESLATEEVPQTLVVFDAHDPPPGLPRETRHKGLIVRFAAREEDADTLIEELIREDTSPRRLTVVSSDHRIQRAAKRRRARAVDSDVLVWRGPSCPAAAPASRGRRARAAQRPVVGGRRALLAAGVRGGGEGPVVGGTSLQSLRRDNPGQQQP